MSYWSVKAWLVISMIILSVHGFTQVNTSDKTINVTFHRETLDSILNYLHEQTNISFAYSVNCLPERRILFFKNWRYCNGREKHK